MESLTERRKQRTYEHLVQVAHDLFLDRGFNDATIEEIAEVAEVSPRTVHRYFPTKEDLFLAHGRLSWEAFIAALRARPLTESPLVAVKHATAQAFGAGWDEGARVRAFLTAVEAAPGLQARWRQQSLAFQADLADLFATRDGRKRAQLTDLVAAGAMSMAIVTAMHEWALHGGDRPLRPVVDRALFALSQPLLSA
jgi:AcrR family transcriptional regulator